MRVEEVPFRHIFAIDFEFGAAPGERPSPRCLVARDLRNGTELKFWEGDLKGLSRAPFPSGSLLVAYYASAEMGCFRSLGWPTDFALLDLFSEFRNLVNGWDPRCSSSLLGALLHFGLPAMDVNEKDSMRALALRGAPYTEEEKQELLAYCSTDVVALGHLFPRILAPLSPDDFHLALLRGRFMTAAAAMEHHGVPIDQPMLAQLRSRWDDVRLDLINELDREYRVFIDGRFDSRRWAAWLSAKGIPWPCTATGRLRLDDQTFKNMGAVWPAVETMRQLRHALSQLKLEELTVGHDGRNRVLLSAFRSITGRSQPSNIKFIFGPSVWMRSLIVAEPGFAIVNVDWEQQEFGIAAYVSRDSAMIAAYEASDPYLKFAEFAGAVPPAATKESHPRQREQFKQCVLAVQYGMGAAALAVRLGIAVPEAEELLRLHRSVFRHYWRWSDGVLDHALLFQRLHTVFGWNLHVTHEPNGRSLRNFPMQANGAEMMRLACILATEGGLELCASMHDAFLLHAPITDLQEHVAELRRFMSEASGLVLGGPRLRTDVKEFVHPARYHDDRGTKMWSTVQELLRRPPRQERLWA